MFALIHLVDENIYDVCEVSAIKSRGRGKYILRSKKKIRVKPICTNESEAILVQIKLQKNSNLPNLKENPTGTTSTVEDLPVSNVANEMKHCLSAPETTNESVVTKRTSVKCRLFTSEDNFEAKNDEVVRESDVGSEPFSEDDSIADPEFDPAIATHSKYYLSSDEEETTREPKTIRVKKNCCVYCKELFSKITPHLERRHSDEEEVRKFTTLPKGSHARKLIIETLRRQGNFIHSQESGETIAVRRTQGSGNNLKVCPNCKGFFSKCSLRKHFTKCNPNALRGGRSLLVMSRKVKMRMHPKASDILRNEIFPVLREDHVVNQIRDDELVIIYGNRLCQKYKSKHLQKMIRAKLRLIGRFMIEIQKLEKEVTDFSSVFQPKFFDSTIKCINLVGKLDENTGMYQAPATAFNLGTTLKFVSNVLISECIKNNNFIKKKEVQDFLKLLQTELATAVNKTVSENQLQLKRQKGIKLPSNEDIKKLFDYLTQERRRYFKLCQDDFTKSHWMQLASYTLISLQLFNRRRAGEIERILIEDFRSQQRINDDDDLFKSLSEESKQAARQYIRFTIRGKLARGVPVLLTQELLRCIELLLEKRAAVGVKDVNPYVFGIPHDSLTHKHLDAYTLLVDYSVKCGAKEPKTLRGTGLRKHIATQCILLDLKEAEVKDLANYLGHADKIHFDHYRMPIAARDITIMSQLLEKAQGSEQLDGPATVEEGDDKEKEEADFCERPVQRTPTKKPIVRTAWITPERQAIKSAFSSHISGNRLPSFKEIKQAQKKFPMLKGRTLPQIKTHVSNEIKRRKRRCDF